MTKHEGLLMHRGDGLHRWVPSLEPKPAYVSTLEQVKVSLEVIATMKPDHLLYEDRHGHLYSSGPGWGLYNYWYRDGTDRFIHRLFNVLRACNGSLSDMDARTLLGASVAVQAVIKHLSKQRHKHEFVCDELSIGYLCNIEKQFKTLSIQKLIRDIDK